MDEHLPNLHFVNKPVNCFATISNRFKFVSCSIYGNCDPCFYKISKRLKMIICGAEYCILSHDCTSTSNTEFHEIRKIGKVNI